MKNSNNNLKLICSIVGGVVIVAAIVVALVHFWDDIKKLLPSCKCKEELDEFEDIEEA